MAASRLPPWAAGSRANGRPQALLARPITPDAAERWRRRLAKLFPRAAYYIELQRAGMPNTEATAVALTVAARHPRRAAVGGERPIRSSFPPAGRVKGRRGARLHPRMATVLGRSSRAESSLSRPEAVLSSRRTKMARAVCPTFPSPGKQPSRSRRRLQPRDRARRNACRAFPQRRKGFPSDEFLAQEAEAGLAGDLKNCPFGGKKNSPLPRSGLASRSDPSCRWPFAGYFLIGPIHHPGPER